MSNPNEQRAVELVRKQLRETPGGAGCADAVTMLSAAGLIVTPQHESALELCERMAGHPTALGVTLGECRQGHDIGRVSLALKQPLGWYADGKCVRYRPARPEADAIVCPDSLTAERVAKALNAQEGK